MEDNKPSSPEEAVALYEGILQSNPEDTAALEALAAAYDQTGNILRARSTLLRLADVLVKTKDSAGAVGAIESLRPLAMADFDALEALNSLEALVAEKPPSEAELAARAASSHRSSAAVEAPPSGVALDKQILDREMRLAWDLLQAKEINQDEYATAIDDLTSQLSSGDGSRTISLLHALVDRNVPGFERIYRYILSHGNCPYVSLASFDARDISLGSVPPEYLRRQGAFAFESLEGELLIALLNPVDPTLRKDLEHYLGVPCYFYATKPDEFDAAWSARGV